MKKKAKLTATINTNALLRSPRSAGPAAARSSADSPVFSGGRVALLVGGGIPRAHRPGLLESPKGECGDKNHDRCVAEEDRAEPPGVGEHAARQRADVCAQQEEAHVDCHLAAAVAHAAGVRHHDLSAQQHHRGRDPGQQTPTQEHCQVGGDRHRQRGDGGKRRAQREHGFASEAVRRETDRYVRDEAPQAVDRDHHANEPDRRTQIACEEPLHRRDHPEAQLSQQDREGEHRQRFVFTVPVAKSDHRAVRFHAGIDIENLCFHISRIVPH